MYLSREYILKYIIQQSFDSTIMKFETLFTLFHTLFCRPVCTAKTCYVVSDDKNRSFKSFSLPFYNLWRYHADTIQGILPTTMMAVLMGFFFQEKCPCRQHESLSFHNFLCRKIILPHAPQKNRILPNCLTNDIESSFLIWCCCFLFSKESGLPEKMVKIQNPFLVIMYL